ncbi:MAG: outer membrane beta-barrel protein [Gammaproteobacteria bacterium]
MKSLSRLFLLGVLSCVPVAAFAASPGSWTGPHIGVLLGGNSSSSNKTDNDLAFTASFLAGYDFQLTQHFVLGVGGFYEWNNQKTHSYNSCPGGGCSVRYGSRIYGLDGRVGFPVGNFNQFMPYVKVGYGRSNLSGDLSGSDSSPRYGVGFEWMSATGTASLLIQFMHQKVNGDHGVSITNNNFTIGANFFF